MTCLQCPRERQNSQLGRADATCGLCLKVLPVVVQGEPWDCHPPPWVTLELRQLLDMWRFHFNPLLPTLTVSLYLHHHPPPPVSLQLECRAGISPGDRWPSSHKELCPWETLAGSVVF